MHGFNRRFTPSNLNEQESRTAIIWDLPLRLFHWLMVSTVAAAAVTGYLAPEWWLDVHVYAGYGLGLLLAFRLAWGFLGSYYSRFRSFPLKFKDALDHLFSIFEINPESHIGHNPVGAWMIVILLITLILLVTTGLVVLGGQENHGPLAFLISFRVGDFTRNIHEILAGVLLGAIAIHLLGVFVEVKILHHPVLRAMISGHKPVTSNYTERNPVGIFRGAILFTAVASTLLFLGVKLDTLASGKWRNIQVPVVYKSECGDCHSAYHPSLRSAADWKIIMDGLDEHYGEDASLDSETARQITTYLTNNAADGFDTEVANNIGRIKTASNRMTDTPYWKKRHRDIQDSIFKKPSVGSKVNCEGCHKDAESGWFADENIHLPNGDKK